MDINSISNSSAISSQSSTSYETSALEKQLIAKTKMQAAKK